jgi:hypothetical protein
LVAGALKGFLYFQAMIRIKAFVKNYISPRTKKYILNHPIDKVYRVIENIRNSNMFLGELDFELNYFTGSEFSISLIRMGNRLPNPSVSYATISVNKDEQTLIDCKRQKNFLGQLFILACIIIGLIFLFRFLFAITEIKYLGFCILFLIVLPYLTIWYTMMTESVLYERFEIYLRKALNESNFSTA